MRRASITRLEDAADQVVKSQGLQGYKSDRETDIEPQQVEHAFLFAAAWALGSQPQQPAGAEIQPASRSHEFPVLRPRCLRSGFLRRKVQTPSPYPTPLFTDQVADAGREIDGAERPRSGRGREGPRRPRLGPAEVMGATRDSGESGPAGIDVRAVRSFRQCGATLCEC